MSIEVECAITFKEVDGVKLLPVDQDTCCALVSEKEAVVSKELFCAALAVATAADHHKPWDAAALRILKDTCGIGASLCDITDLAEYDCFVDNTGFPTEGVVITFECVRCKLNKKED